MTNWTDIPWVIVGAGRLGTFLGLLAEEVGVTVVAAWSRQRRPEIAAVHRYAGPLDDIFDHADDALVWLTVVDDALTDVTLAMVESGCRPRLVLHGSGSNSSRILSDLGVTAPVGSLHPLLSVADPHAARGRAAEAAWTVEGSEPALEFARWFLNELGTEPIEIEPDGKVLYHASAVAASGLVTAVVDLALGLAESAGIERKQARQMLLPLVESTVANLRDRTPRDALTGPVARGDATTLIRHLDALAALDDDDAREIYQLLSKRLANASLRIEAGLDE